MKVKAGKNKINALDVRLRLEDEEVNQRWYPWEPTKDVGSNKVGFKEDWTDSQKALGWMIKFKTHLVSDIYYTHYDHISVIVRFGTGELGVFNNHEYVAFKGDDGFIYLRELKSGKEQLVVDDHFHLTPDTWLRKASGKLGDKKCKGVEWRKSASLRASNIFLKNHIIIAALYFGEKAIGAIGGPDREFDVNHRNLDRDDNRVVNLEIIPKADNRRHREVMYKVLQAKWDAMQKDHE